MTRLLATVLAIVLSFGISACGDTGLACSLAIAAPPANAVPTQGATLDPAWPIIAGPSEFDRAGTAIVTGESGEPVVRLVLREPAAGRLAAFTNANVGAYLAVAIDGQVEIVPTIMAGIPDGTIDLSLPDGDPAADRFRACL